MIQQNKNSLTAVIPVGNYSARKSTISENIPRFLANRAWLTVIFVFSGHSRYEDEVSFRNDFGASIRESNVQALISPDVSPGEGRNVGCRLVVTSHVVFWDDDDTPNLTNLMEAISTCSSDGLIVGQFSRRDPSSPRARIQSCTRNRWHLFLNPGLWRIVFPIGVARSVEFCNSLIGEDVVYVMDILLTNPKTTFLLSEFYEYCPRRDSLSKNFSASKMIQCLDHLDARVQNNFSRNFFHTLVWWSLVLSGLRNSQDSKTFQDYLLKRLFSRKLGIRLLALPVFLFLKVSE
jgi:hypothetical protein